MKLALLAAAAAVSAWAVQPQTPTIRIERTYAGPAIFIHNPTKQPLTAVCIAVAEHPFWEDEIQSPVPPGGDKRLDIDNLPKGLTPERVLVKAAVYEDGSFAGNPQIGVQLVKRRWFVMDTVHELIARVRKAQQADTPKADVLGDLKAWADSLRPVPDAGEFDQRPIDQAAGRTLILNTIATLDKTQSYSDVLVDLLKTEANIATSRPLRDQLRV